MKAVALAAAVVLFAVVYNTRFPHATRNGRDDLNHSYHVFEELWSKDEIADLVDLLRSSPFRSTTAQYTKARDEHIGEAVPLINGSCPNSFMIPNREHTLCHFPERLDVASHQLISGGIDARKESFRTSTSRMIVNQKYFYSEDRDTDIPAVAQLFESENYKKQAAAICGGMDVLEPMMLAMIISLPGQMVAMHYDIPWFHNADRYDLPGWLLVAMQGSGLFEKHRIPQVQGVAYLHSWKNTDERRGSFYFYNKGTGAAPSIVPAKHNTAIICDGTTMVHGTQTYMQEELPPVSKDNTYDMNYVGDSTWELSQDGKHVATYDESDLRVTLVWRQHCFQDEEQKKAWEDRVHAHLALEEVLDVLVGDLIKRNVFTKRPESHRDLALAIIDTYIAYPFPNVAFPYNPCALEAVSPQSMQWLWRTIC